MLVIGLMSGTSVDGIDAAVVEIDNKKPPRLVEFATYPYQKSLRKRILATSSPGGGSTEDVCCLNFLLGEVFAEAALKIIAKADLNPNDIQLIGSHGQTVRHLPNPVKQCGYNISGTLQIGEAAVIARRTGITTVADFRPADMAAGGQGAPLLALLHCRLFQSGEDVIVQNIGGIGNLTYIPANGELKNIIAFDSGPGNMLLDGIMAYFSKGGQSYDHNGSTAAEGKVCEPLLAELLEHPYLTKKPPKTCGREEFGNILLKQIIRQARKLKLSLADLMQTVTVFTAKSIVYAYNDFVFPQAKVKKVLVCGGGRYNLTLMFHLQNELEIPIQPVDDYGVSSDALEAMGFALLAHETLFGRPGNIPAATGAHEAVPLGKISWGRNYSYLRKLFSKPYARLSSQHGKE